MARVLVTGSSGFIGRELCEALSRNGWAVRAVVRRGHRLPVPCAEVVEVDTIDGNTEWSAALDGVQFVVHLAAKVHAAKTSRGSLGEYMEVNARGTGTLATACVAADIRRFVYLSSVKVNGASSGDESFGPADDVHPDGPYGMSKWLGEKYLNEAAAGSRMQAAVVRPPLVYGPGVKANFLTLMRWIDKGRPLPFGAIRNRRSLVSIWNLTDLILALLRHHEPVRGTWMVSDGVDLSTADLVRLIGAAMGRRPALLEVPPLMLRCIGGAFGLREAVNRLCGSLTVDTDATINALAWRPPVSVEMGISRTVAAYLREGRAK